jgi:hypothetical protein
MSASLDAQVIRVKNFVSRPDPRACTSMRIHVPAGVSAFHDAMSSSKPNATAVQSEVHAPVSAAIEDREKGST